jgi:ring-1,2-phenylacetyl-CoA epoxidase subunit PaaC
MSAAEAPAGTLVVRAGSPPLFRYVLRLADTNLVLGQRLGEWVGHAPALEEDLALANLALDAIGRARLLLSYAGEVEGQGHDEDDLAFRRDEPDFHNLVLAEQPNGDFAHTILRQFLLDAFQLELYTALTRSTDARLAAIAGKAEKELAYALRYAAGWVVRLGDGTPESHGRLEQALAALWRFTSEFFAADELDLAMAGAGVAPDLRLLEAPWRERVAGVFAEATLPVPPTVPLALSGRAGRHGEGFGRLLAEMQFLQRAYPGAQW